MKRGVIAGVVALVLVIVIGFVVHYFSSTYELTIQHKNTEQVRLVETESNTILAEDIENNTAIRVASDTPHKVEYAGADGYADGVVQLDDNTTEAIIDPDYSDERNKQLIADARPAIEKTLTQKSPLLDSFFRIGAISIRDKATWLAVQLEYKGEYGFSSDNQIALFKSSNQGETWKLVGGPELLLTTYNTESVPVNILEWTNAKTN